MDKLSCLCYIESYASIPNGGGTALESIFSIVILLLALLFYLAKRSSPINRWCSIYLIIASIGVVKEAFLYQIIPLVLYVWGDVISEEIYLGIYSVLTWIAYSFALPAAFIMALYFYGLNNTNPKLLSIIKKTAWIPAVILSFFYLPINFNEYQLEDRTFWTVYSIYNLSLGIAVIVFVLGGVFAEKVKKIRRDKTILCACILPPTIYVLVTIYVFHWLELERFFKAWQGNVAIIFICLVLYIVLAFKNGFVGLKLSIQVYEWDTDMNIAGKGADYTSHMLKNQTSKMELCIEQLKLQHSSSEQPEELAILSRSINTLKNYVERMKRHSQTIYLIQESCRVVDLLSEALSDSIIEKPGITIINDVNDNIFFKCDKNHMTEVFINIFTNAVEAMSESGIIEITGEYDKAAYSLRIKDNGPGVDNDVLSNVLKPYFTTKNTERNFGLGLSYCKNVIEKHGGSISVKSNRGKGTAVIIKLPSKLVVIG